MTDKQPESLRLADALAYCDNHVASRASAELRRLHEVEQERDALLELKEECWKTQRAIEEVGAQRDAHRQMLLTIMQELDNSVWNCERCGHAEDTKTMDVAYMLRRYLASGSSELESLRKDAERYRWLRTWKVDSYLACGSDKKLDAEIDAAMQAGHKA
ncbi:MAG TPA: hypothetical protein VIN03_11915 [Roseateles sp.]